MSKSLFNKTYSDLYPYRSQRIESFSHRNPKVYEKIKKTQTPRGETSDIIQLFERGFSIGTGLEILDTDNEIYSFFQQTSILT